MTGDYPCCKATYHHDELVEHFLLTPVERALVDACYGDANRHGVAVLLKAVQYLGSFPESLQQVPPEIRTFIAHQLQLLSGHTEEKSLGAYRALALADVAEEYEMAMRAFPVR